MHRHLRLVCCCIVVVTASMKLQAANIADFTDYSLRNTRGQVLLPGRLFVPPEAASDPPSRRPLMVYLHGGGANGTNNTAQVEQTPDPLVDEAKARGAYLYVPQAPSSWASASLTDSVMTMINRVVTEQHADANRLYATGYSSGGGGTWTLLSRNSHRFAAAMAVSGVVPAAGFVAKNLLGTAIIAVHARDDATVPVDRSRTIVNGVLAAAGQPLPVYPSSASDQYLLVANPAVAFHRDVIASEPPGSTINYLITKPDLDLLYFEQPTGGHTGVFGVFYSPDVYDWMFSHSLAVPEPSLGWLAGGYALFCVSPAGGLVRIVRKAHIAASK
jgi:predicted peptidase